MAIFALKSDIDTESDPDTDSDTGHGETFTEKQLGPSLKDKFVLAAFFLQRPGKVFLPYRQIAIRYLAAGK